MRGMEAVVHRHVLIKAHLIKAKLCGMQSKKGADLIYKYPILLDACANEMQRKGDEMMSKWAEVPPAATCFVCARLTCIAHGPTAIRFLSNLTLCLVSVARVCCPVRGHRNCGACR